MKTCGLDSGVTRGGVKEGQPPLKTCIQILCILFYDQMFTISIRFGRTQIHLMRLISAQQTTIIILILPVYYRGQTLIISINFYHITRISFFNYVYDSKEKVLFSPSPQLKILATSLRSEIRVRKRISICKGEKYWV